MKLKDMFLRKLPVIRSILYKKKLHILILSLLKGHQKLVYIILVSIVIFIIGIITPQHSSNSPPLKTKIEHKCTLNKVVDGDTIKVICNSNLYSIRFLHIDAPEMAQKPWGKKAKDKLNDKLTKNVLITTIGNDKYNRTLARVFSSNNIDIGKQMVIDGYARVYLRYKPPKDYINAMKKAKAKGLGIWSTKGLQQDPQRFRRLN